MELWILFSILIAVAVFAAACFMQYLLCRCGKELFFVVKLLPALSVVCLSVFAAVLDRRANRIGCMDFSGFLTLAVLVFGTAPALLGLLAGWFASRKHGNQSK